MHLRAALAKRLGLTAPDETLPARVRAAIHRQQDFSERLAAWVQFGIVIFISVLYILAPKTYRGDWLYPPVTLALAVFLLAVTARLILAYRRRLPGWLLAGSVVFDIVLLLALIWSFHIQYAQPPAFYLKAPTILYLFVFIALRALRFEARYVIIAGVTAAAGWLTLAAYAIIADPAGGAVTKDYVHYLTSNSVLIGAEVSKTIAILVFTGVLSVALVRARRLMVRSVVEAVAARDLSRFFAPEVAARITGAERRVGPGHGEARQASILTTDIRGFTRLAREMEPSDLIGLLVEYESRLVPVIQRHGGSIDKFLGDGILATFGAAEPSDSHAADAMRALEAVIVESDAWNAERSAAGRGPLTIGAAVTTGRVVFGAVGDASRLEYTVIGDAVNLAAKLEKHNKVLVTRALATEAAVALAAEQGYRPAREPDNLRQTEIPGIEEPIDIVVIAR